jgi:hypothetical protein
MSPNEAGTASGLIRTAIGAGWASGSVHGGGSWCPYMTGGRALVDVSRLSHSRLTFTKFFDGEPYGPVSCWCSVTRGGTAWGLPKSKVGRVPG